MTDALIDQMDAGEALDWLVATEVMGWVLPDDTSMPRSWMCDAGNGKRCWAGWWAMDPPQRRCELTGEWEPDGLYAATGSDRFRPSEDIAAAWAVLESFNRQGISADVSLEGDFSFVALTHRERGTYTRDGNTPERVGEGQATTPQVAICRAALRAARQTAANA